VRTRCSRLGQVRPQGYLKAGCGALHWSAPSNVRHEQQTPACRRLSARWRGWASHGPLPVLVVLAPSMMTTGPRGTQATRLTEPRKNLPSRRTRPDAYTEGRKNAAAFQETARKPTEGGNQRPAFEMQGALACHAVLHTPLRGTSERLLLADHRRAKQALSRASSHRHRSRSACRTQQPPRVRTVARPRPYPCDAQRIANFRKVPYIRHPNARPCHPF